ncbi:hypothetical protein [Thioalkalivibrio sp. ALR17-21]|uniref:hypothetical protein n=1 Tax=Thioalkalivibrio sp. ALR17-21 TaxID=1269813 RepID=UPI00040BAC0E|nr:hypothetical protein [Thioalkalivibrio sp. ALR17-21]
MSERHLVQFYSPETGTRSYRQTQRRGRATEIDLPYDIEARITRERGQNVDEARTGRVVLYKGPEQERIWAGEWQTGTTFTGTLPADLEFEPTDALILTTEIRDNGDFAVWPRCEPVYIGAPASLETPRWVAVRFTRNPGDGDIWRGVGYVWYPGRFPDITPSYHKRRDPLIVRGRPGEHDLWAQRMTFCTVYQRSEFQYTDKGHVASHFKHEYRRHDYFKPLHLQVGLFRDGHRNQSTIQSTCSGFIDEDQTAVILSAPGRVVEVDVHGTMKTLWGVRNKKDLITPAPGNPHVWTVHHPDHFETVRKDIGHCWQICPHPDDEGIVFIAASHHHCIYRGDRRTGEIEVFAGTEHEKGYQRGLSEPRGVAARDGWLYISDYRNLRIVRTPLDGGGGLEEVIASMRPSGLSRRQDFPFWDGTQEIDVHFDQDVEVMRERAVWGEAGKAAFLYPTQIDFTSAGDLICTHDLQFSVSRIRLGDPVTIEHLGDVQYYRKEYMTVSVDREGSLYAVDDFIVTAGDDRSDVLFSVDGENLGIPSFFPDGGGYDRDWNRASRMKYNNLCIVGRGAMWYGGNTGLMRVTRKRESDPKINNARYKRGRRAFRRAPSPYRPALELVHGPRGNGHFGRETIDDLGAMDEQAFRKWLDTQGRRDIQGDEFDDLYYYIAMESATGKGMAEDVEVAVPVAPPWPDPQPGEPEPEKEEGEQDGTSR